MHRTAKPRIVGWSAMLAFVVAAGCTGADDTEMDRLEGGGGNATSTSTTSTDTTTDTGTTTSSTTTSATDPWEPYRQACVDRINELRATLGRAPYQRWTSAELCVDEQATHDQSVNTAHHAFAYGTPACGGAAQNECPNYSAAAIVGCLNLMWSERNQPGCSGCDACTLSQIHQDSCPNCSLDDPTQCVHYVSMSTPSFTRVACGFSDDGSWGAQNFE